MINIILADDHAIMRSGLKEIIAAVKDFNLIADVSNGGMLLDLLRRDTPDVVMTDMHMPGISGIDLIERIRRHYPQLPILVLTMLDEPQVASRAIKAGANGFVTKDSPPEDLILALRKVAGGGKYIDRELAERLLFTSESRDVPHHALTDREREIFDPLVRGMSVNAIALELCISNKTVSTHKVHLLEKMHMSSTAELVKYAVTHGLVQ